MATFIVAFVARPLGGIVFGHFGDKLGRKGTLVTALLMMGIATTLIGLLPSSAQIGVWAPLLLVLLRVVQGISMGAEYSGSLLMALEHAHPKRRTFYGALLSSGLAWGTLIANGLFLLVSQLPEESFLGWGWRIPFLVSALLVLFCLYLRLNRDESPEFQAVAEEKAETVEKSVPIVEVLRRHWLTSLLVIILIPGLGMVYFSATVFSLTYATSVGIDRDSMLTSIIIAQVVLGIGMPLFGWIADRTGLRRPILLGGFLGIAAVTWVWFALLNTNSFPLIALGFCIYFLPYSAAYATMPATIAHVFPPEVRFTGVALGYNVGTMVGSATAPLVAMGLYSATGSWWPVAVYLTCGALLAMGATVFLRERYISPAAV